LFLNQFESDIESVVENALNNGVTKIFNPNVDSSTVDRLDNLCKKFKDICFPLMGVHPESVKENFENELQNVETLLKNNKFYGVGEIGIDLYWDKTFLNQQIEAFYFQIELAKKLNLPIVIHTREAFKEVFSVVDKLWDTNLKGIFHCFSGTYDDALHILDYKTFKLGIGGVVTYKKSGLDEIISKINLENLVLETDSPFLTPVPHRGKRNESAYLVLIAQKLSEIYSIDIEKIAEITTKNAFEIFEI
jgi:TatD DNase family protein